MPLEEYWDSKIVINGFEILKCHSILKRKTSNAKELMVNKKTTLWIYDNKLPSLEKKITKKQITFLCKLLSFFVKYQNNPTTTKLLASKLYLPSEIVEKVLELPQLKENLLTQSPLLLLEKTIDFITLRRSNFFSLSFFSMITLPLYYQTTNIETYILNYRKINSENLRLFKTLMKKDIVVISNNLLGDYVIHPMIPNQKTKRNSIITSKGRYIIPLDKINIIDLTTLVYLSSSTRIVENTITGRISKKKLQQIENLKILGEIKDILTKLNLHKT